MIVSSPAGQERLSALQEKITVTKLETASFSEIESMGTKRSATTLSFPVLIGNTFPALPKSRDIVAELKERITTLSRKISSLEKRLKQYER